MSVRIKFQNRSGVKYNAQQVNQLLQSIHPTILKFQSHQFKEGIYLARRVASVPPGASHYSLVATGKYAQSFDPHADGSIVIHKTNQPGRHRERLNPLDWEKVQEINPDNLESIIERMRTSWNEPYNLFFDNCEHWARYVATGKKVSSQVQGVVKFGLAAACLACLFDSNH